MAWINEFWILTTPLEYTDDMMVKAVPPLNPAPSSVQPKYCLGMPYDE